MRAIVYYYSMNGRCEALARRIAEKMECDVVGIKEQRGRLSRGFLRFLNGGAAMSGKSSRIRPVLQEPKEYDCVVLVSPIWASSPTPAIRGFVDAYRDQMRGKQLGVVVANMGSDPAKALAKFDSMLEVPFVSKSFTRSRGDWEPDRERALIAEFVSEISP